MSANCNELKAFRDKIQNLSNTDAFLKSCSKELAARLLAKVIKRTPVGKYPNTPGKTGGTLRRGWTGEEKNVNAFVESIAVNHVGDRYVIEIVNPTDYASYVEYGHRTRGGKGWVNGQFMLTISEKELQATAQSILEAKLNKWLKDVMK